MEYNEPNFEIFEINNKMVICTSPGLEWNESQESDDFGNMDDLQ